MNQYALITGGASGLGKDLSILFAQRGISLFLVSSNIKNLEAAKSEIEKEYKVDVHVLAIDLTNPSNFHLVKEYSDSNNLDIRYLINCAGFGDQCEFKDMDIEKQIKMVELNDNCPMYLMNAYINDFLKKEGTCYILNVASVASFFPGPHMCTYHASKAFLLNISEAIRRELKGSNVSISTICPGPFESGFVSKAHNDYVFETSKVLTSRKVAEISMKLMDSKKSFKVIGFKNKMNIFISRFFSRDFVTNGAAKSLKKNG